MHSKVVIAAATTIATKAIATATSITLLIATTTAIATATTMNSMLYVSMATAAIPTTAAKQLS
jgi:biotin carboxylase